MSSNLSAVSPTSPGNDDPYAELFRPEDSVPELVDSPVTGRIFKSQGVAGHEEALIAIPTFKSGKLRTLDRDSIQHTDVISVPGSDSVVELTETQATSGRTRQQRDSQASFIGSLTAPLVYLITIGVTLIFGLGNVLIFGGPPGIFTGIGLICATLFVSFAVRPTDDIHAIYAPAISFFIMAITVGQIGLPATSLLNRLIEVFLILGSNWIWIIGSTVIALTIIALRRRSLS
jgi:hypothetical protein